ncbi:MULTISPECIES: divalent-cation tolerance protein CutA [Xanthobacter]|uniref:divalent-cation tolerance protein CutA n=1 Tax=Xanthobacter TaxID=279 RepID=UPI001F19AD15|nr:MULTISPECIES: divalent-cation tolerance protein CutA [unclassified Xanthobacter]
MDLKLVYTTLPSLAVAEELARTLVEERLAACGNIRSAQVAIYEWEGRIERAEEVILLLKTTAERAPALVERVRARHPYEVPAILVLPVEAADAAFSTWVGQQTANAAK